MQNVTFVMGAVAAGKTYFIDTHYSDKDVDILNVYDYQQRAYKEAEGRDYTTLHEKDFRCLMKANNMLLADILERLGCGRDVVVEQTFYKAKRRIAYIDAIRKAADVFIEIYVMCPDDTRWEVNWEQRKLGGTYQRGKDLAAQIEFPNPAEGIDRIYEVADGEIRLRMEPPKPEIVDKAWEELTQEAE